MIDLVEHQKPENLITRLEQTKSIKKANNLIESVTNIVGLFKNEIDLRNFIEYLKDESFSHNQDIISKEWGDVQTPNQLVNQIYDILIDIDFNPYILIEATFGLGHFIQCIPEEFTNLKQVYGVEIQQKHIFHYVASQITQAGSKEISQNNQYTIRIFQDDIFHHQFAKNIFLDTKANILLIGNPPWVTLSELSSLNSSNLPTKSNIKGFSGIEAITGRSNFDIAESIITRLLHLFSDHQGKLAFLCKDSVIRNFVKEIQKTQFPISNIRALKIDARKNFGKNCDASLFLADLIPGLNDDYCNVSDIESPNQITRKFGWINEKFVSDIKSYRNYSFLDKLSNYTWRQGVKHDCSKILELQVERENQLFNKLNENLTIEKDLIYPLLKGSNLKKFEVLNTSKRLLLTQTKLGEDTSYIKERYPKTWNYLSRNKKYFDKRKSRVFQNKFDFTIFGIGDYTFSPFKVAIAGLYKTVQFTFIPPINKKPVLLDDTCYFLGFQAYNEALFFCTILNSSVAKGFFKSIVFLNSKRPFTKEILMRISFSDLANSLTFNDIQSIWEESNFKSKKEISKEDYIKFKKSLI